MTGRARRQQRKRARERARRIQLNRDLHIAWPRFLQDFRAHAKAWDRAVWQSIKGWADALNQAVQAKSVVPERLLIGY